jgi:hypothetical protein
MLDKEGAMGLREKAIAETWDRVSAIRSEKYAGSRPVFDVAMEREHWDLASLCLLVGAVETLQKLPRDTVEALMDELEAEVSPHRGSRAREKSDWRGHQR